MNNLLRLEQGEARLVADDPWVLVRDDVPAGGALILPLASYAPGHGVWLGPDDEEIGRAHV